MAQYVRNCFFILLSFLLLPLSLSCSSPLPRETNFSTEITDQLGRTVKLNKIPQRIVSLAPSNTEILFALGLGERVVGVTDYCNYPPEAKEKPSVGGFSTPNIEKMVAIDSDLILATSIHQKQIIPQLEAKGMTVFAVAPRTIDEVLDAITQVGEITGKETEAARLVADMRSKIKEVTDKTGNLSGAQKPRVFYITWHDPLKTAGAGTFQDELIRNAGSVNIAGNLSGYAGISLESVIEANSEVIIAGVGMGSGADAPLQFAKTEPRLKDVAARQNDRIFAVDTDIVGRTGPRIADALEQFGRFIHPELFK